ncbi:hypothetical protein K438DRAFT_1724776 [Mycena galopus ATCC 62051]|nr:hypothetical protein K438DRAFT_1724776 [Mycena galopus ATCC 62051]
MSSSSNALMPWDPHVNTASAVATIPEDSRSEGGRWALVLNAFLSPSPGRTLDRLYTSVGKVLETHVNRAAHTFGLGPHAVAEKIKFYFGDAEDRVQRLELLRMTISPKLAKRCLKLIRYTLPTEAANTQCQAFKEIVDLVTIFPGLRILFLQTKLLENATSFDAVSDLWDRSTGAPDKEWTFWQTLAATCLADTTIPAILEKISVADLGTCYAEDLGVIEHLLIEHDCCGSSKYSRALCVRYLAGVLNLPGFWLNRGNAHAHVANKLCCQLGHLLKDIGADNPVLGPITESEAPFDYAGVDILALTLLGGISGWFAKLEPEEWSLQPWVESFTGFLKLLRAPRAAELLPHSSDYATKTFENIIPTIYRDVVLHLMVDGHSTISDEPEGTASDENHLTGLDCDNMSTHSAQNDTIQGDCGSSAASQSLDDAESQHTDEDPVQVPAEDDESTLLPDVSNPEAMPTVPDTASDISLKCEDQFGLNAAYGSSMIGDSDTGNPQLQRITGSISPVPPILLNSMTNSYTSLADRQKKAEELRVTLLQKQRDIGDNHLDTLVAMENLAWVQHDLGDFISALDLRVMVLEKSKSLLGNNHEYTLNIMHSLGSTYRRAGQLKEAESLLLSALRRQKEVLGESHPATLFTMTSLAAAYRSLGHWEKAESLEILSMKKQIESVGENHVDTLRTMGNLATTYECQGQFNKATELDISVLEKRRELLGDDHPGTLVTAGNLARTYSRLGRWSEAEQLHCVVFEKRRKLLGDNHPDTLKTMGQLGLTYSMLGQLEEAEDLLGIALEKQTLSLGEDHPDRLLTLSYLVSIYHQMGRLSIAKELAQAALAKQRRVLGEDHSESLWTMSNLAWICRQQGQFERAEALYVVALENQRKRHGDGDTNTRWTMQGLALTYRDLGKPQAAIELERLLKNPKA